MDPVTLSALTLVTLLGASVGSFANVVAYRLPRGQSLTTPPSRCPRCERRLTPLELIPVLSWLALRGKCRGCRQPISARYPTIEALFAITYLTLALLTRPDLTSGGELARYALQAAAISMLLIAALIDLDTIHLPDTLTYGALTTALLASLLPANPSAAEALAQPAGTALALALMAAGALALLERYATVALRRNTTPTRGLITSDHLLLAATLAALLGPLRALTITSAVILINTRTKAHLRLPQALHLALIPLLVITSHFLGKPALHATMSALTAAGAMALIGGITWWVRDALAQKRALKTGAPQDEETGEASEVLGFGDVKLAAALATLLPNPLLLILALLLASLTGVLHGVTTRQRALPFGPHLVLGAAVAATIGPAIINWYATLTGIPL